MLKIKEGVRLAALLPPAIDALQDCMVVFAEAGYEEIWLTSTDEGTHGYASLHYVGLAFDLGTKNRGIGRDEARELVRRIRSAVGPGYDVLAEDTHIHVEYQPKTGEPRWTLSPLT